MLPSFVLAVTMAVPIAFASIVPSVTVATVLSLLDHVTVLSVALDGATVAVSVSVSPTERDNELLLSVTPVTATGLN